MATFVPFAFLWALSALLDAATVGSWPTPAHALFPIAGMFVLVRPRSVPGFLVFNLLLATALFADTPYTANHQFLFLVASAAILVAWLQEAWRARRAGDGLRVDAAAWVDAFAPTLRALLVILYGFAVFHKLNRDYFDPRVSCAVHLFSLVEANWGTPLWPRTGASRLFMIHASLATEALIPLLLCWRRTRWLGVVVGIAFHTLLGISFYAFSTGLFALYALFVPRRVLEAAADAARALRGRHRIAVLLSPTAAQGLGIVLVLGLALAWRLSQGAALATTGVAIGRGLRLAWTAGALSTLAVVSLSRRARPHWGEALPGGLLPRGAGLIFPLIAVLAGLSPYLGLRTAPAFSMFSNLRTEGGVSNHWLVPAGMLEMASHQRDLVAVQETSSALLDSFRTRGLQLVYFDFRRRLQEGVARRGPDAPPVSVRYRRWGRSHRASDVASDEALMAEIPWYERKWMRFRPVPRRGGLCAW